MDKGNSQPLINLLTFQEVAFWLRLRTMFFLWARQRGKSYLIAAKAIDRMLERAGRSCYFVSASIATGKEIVEKEAQIWHDALAKLRAKQEALGKELGGNVVDKRSHKLLAVDDLAEVMDKQTVQVRIYYTRTSYSRTKILAPNPDTARGWTGDVFGDEVGFWPDFRAVLDAVEPIISRNPDFLMWMFTTPPEDDKHFTYDFLNPGPLEFTPNAQGNFYKTEAGYPVHRVDIFDSELAGSIRSPASRWRLKNTAPTPWTRHLPIATMRSSLFRAGNPPCSWRGSTTPCTRERSAARALILARRYWQHEQL